MLKKMVSLALAAAMASTMLLSVGAAEIMPLAGSECPNCGYEGYGYQYRYGNWNLVDPVRAWSRELDPGFGGSASSGAANGVRQPFVQFYSRELESYQNGEAGLL